MAAKKEGDLGIYRKGGALAHQRVPFPITKLEIVIENVSQFVLLLVSEWLSSLSHFWL